ncbi:Protein of unknown function [Actinopolyspora xinjiangensis]|uniref:DUF3558 domain-containing protein n=1 Tax=Actinopolyspora xinjiangensis TaxID=405564 RepID=A0A1H0WH81_9ACTN|nr:DUF3558 domain-containing protein [Actinopolyspora xinjiangensis]SDP89646.1 Protein of unknown function [Actinopolyspora xinjiangensis]
MNRRMRSLAAVIAGAALIGAAGCSSGGGSGNASETDTSSSEESLASMKPCDVLPQDTLKSLGLEVPGESVEHLPWAPGCDYDGDPVGLTLELNKREAVADAEQKSVWAEFERLKVNGRAGARAIVKGATQARGCDVMFDAGEGMVQVRTTETGRFDSVDECAKALEIAKKVEPNVPEPA